MRGRKKTFPSFSMESNGGWSSWGWEDSANQWSFYLAQMMSTAFDWWRNRPDDQQNLKDYKKTNCLVNVKLKALQSVAENIKIWYLELYGLYKMYSWEFGFVVTTLWVRLDRVPVFVVCAPVILFFLARWCHLLLYTVQWMSSGRYLLHNKYFGSETWYYVWFGYKGRRPNWRWQNWRC